MIGIIFGRRSGTSSLSHGLFDLGYPLREPLDRREMTTQPGGHWENMEARTINREIMRHFAIGAAEPGIVPFLKYGPLEEWINKHQDPFVVKEPNINLTWPVWLRTLRALGRPAVGIWCRRAVSDQEASLVRNYQYDAERARWCVQMYELSIKAATDYIPMVEVWLWDDRITRAAAWLDAHDIHPKVAVPDTVAA